MCLQLLKSNESINVTLFVVNIASKWCSLHIQQRLGYQSVVTKNGKPGFLGGKQWSLTSSLGGTLHKDATA